MKLTIDTDRKVIEIDQAINMKDLVKGLKKLLGDEWDKYSIEQRVTYNYWPYIPQYPSYTDPYITYVDNGTTLGVITYEN